MAVSELEHKRNAYRLLVKPTKDEAESIRLITRQELCKLRRRANGKLTQEEYAKWCKVPLATIQKIESFRPFNPRWEDDLYLRVLGVTKDFVFDHVEWLRYPEGYLDHVRVYIPRRSSRSGGAANDN